MDRFKNTSVLTFVLICEWVLVFVSGQWSSPVPTANSGNFFPSNGSPIPPPVFRPDLSPTVGGNGGGRIIEPGGGGFHQNQNSFHNGYSDRDHRNFFPPPSSSSSATAGGSHVPFSSNSKSISGDYCFEPILTCDTTNTILYCIEGRCTCPTQWTLSPANQPLNTVWHPEMRRCVSVVGSGCHLATNTGRTRSNPFVFPSSSPLQSQQSPYLTQPQLSGSIPIQASEPPGSTQKQVASSLIKGFIDGVVGGSGNGYVYCQPGVPCVRHYMGSSEIGICSAAKLSSLSLILVLGISLIFHVCIQS